MDGGQQSTHAAAAAGDPERQRRLATVVVGGAGATGVELAGELAEMLPKVASRQGLASDRPAVLLVEAGPTILAGSQRCTRPATSPRSWNSRTGHVLPALAQVALEEGETVARNLDGELKGRPLEQFTFHDKGFVVSWPRHRKHDALEAR